MGKQFLKVMILIGIVYGMTVLMSGKFYGWTDGFCAFFGIFVTLIILANVRDFGTK